MRVRFWKKLVPTSVCEAVPRCLLSQGRPRRLEGRILVDDLLSRFGNYPHEVLVKVRGMDELFE